MGEFRKTMMRVFVLMAMASLALGGLTGKTGIYSDSACTTKLVEYTSSFGAGCQKSVSRVYNNSTKTLSNVYPTTGTKSYMIVGTIDNCNGGQKYNQTFKYTDSACSTGKTALAPAEQTLPKLPDTTCKKSKVYLLSTSGSQPYYEKGLTCSTSSASALAPSIGAIAALVAVASVFA